MGDNHGSLQGDVTFGTGIVGQAFSFDGTGDYIKVPHNPSLNLRYGISVDAWFKLDAIPENFPGLVTKGKTNEQYLLFVDAIDGAASSTASVCWRVNLGKDNPISLQGRSHFPLIQCALVVGMAQSTATLGGSLVHNQWDVQGNCRN